VARALTAVSAGLAGCSCLASGLCRCGPGRCRPAPPAPDGLGEERLPVAGLLADDAVELAEQLERHGPEQRRQGHESPLQQGVGHPGPGDGAERRERFPAAAGHVVFGYRQRKVLGGVGEDARTTLETRAAGAIVVGGAT